jgi:hypothetical protein
MRLEVTPDAEFKQWAAQFNLEVAGPSKRGAFLVRTQLGKVYLFGALHSEIRIVVPSIWTPENVAYMNGVEVL